MDCTLNKAKQELVNRLVELGKRLDSATDPETMKSLIGERKRDQAAVAVLRALTPALDPSA